MLDGKGSVDESYKDVPGWEHGIFQSLQARTSTSTPSRNPQTHTTHGEEENIFRSRRLDSGFTKDVGFSRHGERV